MDAPTALTRAPWSAVETPVVTQLARAVAASLLALLAIAALVICARRAGGALVEPLSGARLSALGGVLAAAALGFRSVAANRGLDNRLARYLLWAVPTVVLALWAVGLSLRETSSGGLIGLLGLLLLEEGWSWGRFVQVVLPGARGFDEESPGGAGGYTRHAPGGLAARDALARIGSAGITLSDDPAEALDEDVDSDITQRLIRRAEDGGERIEGWLRVDFAPAQRLAMAHVAICPPFARVPQCDAEQADGPPSQVRVAQVLPYGVRIEIKLDEPAAESSQVLVEFSIVELPDDGTTAPQWSDYA